MFIISLNYIVPLEELDEHMVEHVKYLNKYYKKNVFVASEERYPEQEVLFLHLLTLLKR